MVSLKYTGANGKMYDLRTESAADAMMKLSHIPGFINNDADALTNGLGASLKERRKQRAAEFASGSVHQAGIQQSVAKAGIGATTILPGFGGLVVEKGNVVGAKIYDIKTENGLIVGTSGMREERFNTESSDDFNKRLETWFTGWFGGWWAQNWRTYAHW